MILWRGGPQSLQEPELVVAPLPARRRKLFGYGGRLRVRSIRRRIDRAGSIEALARTFDNRT